MSNIKEQVQKMDEMVSQGNIVNAVKEFYADNATTSDYGNVTTSNKAQMIEKMEGFLGAIAQVNHINLQSSLQEGNLSASEFDIDLDMKDGSKIKWHEIIKREWNTEGKVIHEAYFDAQH